MANKHDPHYYKKLNRLSKRKNYCSFCGEFYADWETHKLTKSHLRTGKWKKGVLQIG